MNARTFHIAAARKQREDAAREAHIAAEVARIEAAPEVDGAWLNRHPASRDNPHDPDLDAQFAHLRTHDTFRRPVGWVPWGDEVPGGAA